MSKKRKKPLTKRQKNKRKLILFVIEIIILIILLFAFWVALKISKINTKDVGEVNVNDDIDEKSQLLMDKYTNIALFGLDNRSNGNYETGNADSIIIASINNDTKEVRLVSVYRDTYLQVDTAGTYSKVNSAYRRNDGALGMMETLNRNLDMDIQNYISVDWYALVKTINLLGGIDVEMTDKEAQQVNKYMGDITKVTGYERKGTAVAGANHMDGVMALSYARIRKGVGDDFARTERQRTVIKLMLEKMKTAGVSTLTSIMDEVFPDIETSFSYSDLLTLGSAMLEYNMTETMGFPQDKGGMRMANCGSSVIPVSLMTNVQELHKFLFADEAYNPSVTVQEISNNIIYVTGMVPEIKNADDDTTTEQ